jgi:hypothetical protein
MRQKKANQKKATHLALLLAAAQAHEDWEIVTDDNGEPCSIRRKGKAGPRTPKELATWFVDVFPERAARILTGKAPTLH